MTHEVVAIADSIKSNVQHTGKNFELVLAAYNEIRAYHGHPKTSSTLCQSGCITQMNTIVGNWLRASEADGSLKKLEPLKPIETGKVIGSDLVPLDSRRKAYEEMDYTDIRKEAIEKLGEDKCKALNNGKPAKKSQLIDALLLA